MEISELSDEELIALQEMMGFVKPSTVEEAELQKSIYGKISEVVGTPESRKAEQERDEINRRYAESLEHLDKCLGSLNDYFEKKDIVLESRGPVFLKDINTGLVVRVL